MLRFRILGPLEATDEQGAIALGGPRQRAVLAALLLRAGRVVPTEQLVDELYGAEPPKSATASLHNSVVALRKALGPDVLVTRPPGYVLAVSRSDRCAAIRAAAGGRTKCFAGRAPLAAPQGARALAWPTARRVRVRRLGAGRDPPARGAAPRCDRGADRRGRRAGPSRGGRPRARGPSRRGIPCGSGRASC